MLMTHVMKNSANVKLVLGLRPTDHIEESNAEKTVESPSSFTTIFSLNQRYTAGRLLYLAASVSSGEPLRDPMALGEPPSIITMKW